MNEIEKAMLDLQQHIGILDMRLQRDPGSCNDDFLSKIDSYSLAIQALEEKAERDKMRCANCEHGCPADYGICSCASHKMNDTDYDTYCSYFEPKESEDKASE